MPSDKKDILLFSGGPDSLIAWYYLNKPPGIYINSNHRYARKELKAIHYFQKELDMDLEILNDIFDFSNLEQSNAYIPYRNLFFSMLGALYGSNIWLVGTKDENVEDKTPKAYSLMSSCLNEIGKNKNIKIDSPFKNMSKGSIVKWYLDKGYSPDILLNTVSCYTENTGDYTHCGSCSACFRRWIAFEYNGLKQDFLNDITKWSGINDYISKMKEGLYDPERTEETFYVLKKFNLI